MKNDNRARHIYVAIAMLFFGLLTSLSYESAQAASPQLVVSYSDTGADVIEIQITKQINNPDGSISAEISLISKTFLTYGFMISADEGQIIPEPNGNLDNYLGYGKTIPFLAKWEIPLGRVIFSPGARLHITLDNVKLIDDSDTAMLFELDLANAFFMFAGLGHIPQNPSEIMTNLALSSLEMLRSFSLDMGTMVVRADRGDEIGALQTLGTAIALNPNPFVSYLKQQFGLSISEDAMASFGNYLSRFSQAAGVFPILSEFHTLPRHVDVTLSVQTTDSSVSQPTTSFGDLTSTLVPATDLSIGQSALVFTINGETLDVLSQPSTNAQQVGTLEIGAEVNIVDGLHEADGYWWHIQTTAGVDGWVVDSVDGIMTLVREEDVGSQQPTTQATSSPPSTEGSFSVSIQGDLTLSLNPSNTIVRFYCGDIGNDPEGRVFTLYFYNGPDIGLNTASVWQIATLPIKAWNLVTISFPVSNSHKMPESGEYNQVPGPVLMFVSFDRKVTTETGSGEYTSLYAESGSINFESDGNYFSGAFKFKFNPVNLIPSGSGVSPDEQPLEVTVQGTFSEVILNGYWHNGNMEVSDCQS